jgi:mRNA-degrading endonuclease toxin of MazEF toxin-antitoxin module
MKAMRERRRARGLEELRLTVPDARSKTVRRRVDAQDFRVAVEPSTRNGLRTRSHVMADKPVTIRRTRIGRKIGHFHEGDIARLNVALAFVVRLAD